MNKYLFLLIIIISVSIISCNPDRSNLIAQIRDTETRFEAMAGEKGMAEAFSFFADTGATIKRQNDSLIHGKEGIRKFYSADFYKTASVKWAPDYVDVSSDGTMGYTYGKYVWTSKDTSGKPIEYRGIFHTVWKKQKDGEWRYVWD